tara:strand:- start:37 stop:174 length:138 start_codon:yes stop_codon:yes gene_type:complete
VAKFEMSRSRIDFSPNYGIYEYQKAFLKGGWRELADFRKEFLIEY